MAPVLLFAYMQMVENLREGMGGSDFCQNPWGVNAFQAKLLRGPLLWFNCIFEQVFLKICPGKGEHGPMLYPLPPTPTHLCAFMAIKKM